MARSVSRNFRRGTSSPRWTIGLTIALSSGGLSALGCDATLAGMTGLSSEPGGAAENPDGEGEHAPAPLPELPGYSVIRRLNRAEYQNTVRDLLGTKLAVTDSFPADDLGGEFATVGSALSLSPLYVVSYERAAYELVDELFASTGEQHDAVLHCDVETAASEWCLKDLVTKFSERAFRRPLNEGELEVLLQPYRTAEELGATKTEGLRHTLAAILLSPHFLFKVEAESSPDSGQVRDLSPYEIASRLSYALWATMPDETLMARAKAGDLSSDQAIEEEIGRMLDDERAEGFLDNFVAYWLNYARLDKHEVEARFFPDYTPELAESMRGEAHRFIAEFLASDRPVREMLAADFTFLDERLAAHYGMDLPAGTASGEFARVDTQNTQRGGLLTLGALLMTTSFSSRTSVVVRGAYVFDRLLCGEIPPPPPGVEGLEFDTEGLTQRERLDLHRQDPSCKSCHEIMDPLGFGLENYDAIGGYRDLDAGLPVDASGELPDGQTFEGAIELGRVLAEDVRFSECITQKFMTYALGRIVSHKDPWLHYLVEQVDPENATFRGILREVLLSDAFRKRQAGEADE